MPVNMTGKMGLAHVPLYFAHVRRVPSLCCARSPNAAWVSRSIFTHPGRHVDAQASTRSPRLRSNCANCAQGVRSSVGTVGTHSGCVPESVLHRGTHRRAKQMVCNDRATTVDGRPLLVPSLYPCAKIPFSAKIDIADAVVRSKSR